MINSTPFGNIIGIISLAIGIISLFITIKTMKTAKRTEEAVLKAQHETANKIVFQELKDKSIPLLKTYVEDATSVSFINHKRCNSVLAIIGQLRGQCISEVDNSIISDCFIRLSNLYKDNESIPSAMFIDIVTRAIATLEKGDNRI